MIILAADDVRRALPMAEAIEAMKSAYAALSGGLAEVPLRSRLPIPPHEAMALLMPVYMQDGPGEARGEAMAVKVVTLFPHNRERNLPLIHAVVLVFETGTGRPVALLEGGSLTAIRTGAASGAATDLLALPDSRIAAIFGAGAQARTQLEAVCTVRPIQTAWIYDLEPSRVETFITEMAGRGPVPENLRAAPSPRAAVNQADIICTATSSASPVFADADLKPGVHINGIGSYTPEMQEVPAETVRRSLVVIDSRSASLSEAGDLIQPIRQGLISAEHIHAELGEIVLGKRPGRSSSDQVTFFKSVGVAVQDAAAARVALQNAEKMGLGQSVAW
jgi:ornithine cyclodeaminase